MARHFSRNSTDSSRGISGLLTRVVLLCLGLYRAWSQLGVFRVLAPTGAYGCRFPQSCSVFAMDVIRRDGLWVGGRAAMERFTRCHPWGSVHN